MDNSILIANIEAACKAKGEKVTPACSNAGVGTSFVQNLKKGQKPSFEKVALLASYLGTTTSALLGEKTKKEPSGPKAAGLSEAELDSELVKLLCRLTPEDYRRVKDFVAGLIASREA